MPSQLNLVQRWADKHSNGDLALELPALFQEDGACWTVRMVLRGVGPVGSRPDSWDAIVDLAGPQDNATVEVCHSGNGGRWVFGTLLTRGTAARMKLAEHGLAEDRVAIRWIDPNPGPNHHEWAARLGVTIDKGKPVPVPAKADPPALSGYDWHPRPGEDLLVHSFWRKHAPGSLFVEVPMPDDGARKIDAVVVADGNDRVVGRNIHWNEIGADIPVSVIEAKQFAKKKPKTKGGRDAIEMVLGQAAAAGASVGLRLGRAQGEVTAVVLVDEAGPTLQAIGERIGVDVAAVEPSTLIPIALAPGDELLDTLRARSAKQSTRLATEAESILRDRICAPDVGD